MKDCDQMKGEEPRRRHTQDELYLAPLVALGPWLASHGVSTASRVPPRDSDWPSEQNGPFWELRTRTAQTAGK